MIELNPLRKLFIFSLPLFFILLCFFAFFIGGKPLSVVSVIVFLGTILLCMILLYNKMALLSPMFMFCLLQLTLYSLNWLPFITTDFLWNDTYFDTNSHSIQNAIVKLNLLASIWVIVATFTHLLFKFDTKWEAIDKNYSFKLIGLIIVAFSIFSFAFLVSKAGSIIEILIQREITREDRLASQIGRHWYALAQTGTLGVALWAFSDKLAFKTWYFYPILLLVIVVGFIVSGNRTSIVMSCILIYAAWVFHSKKIFSLSVVVMGVLLISVLGLATLIREEGVSSFQNGEAYNNTQINTLTRIWEIRSERSISGSASLGVLISLEDGAPLLLGESYKSILYIPVPSSMLSGTKPPAGGRLAAYKLSGRTDTAWPINPVIETYWNFGIFGVLISAVIYGLLSSIIFSVIKNNFKSTIMIVGYFSYVTLFSVGSDGFYKFFQAAIPLFSLYFFLLLQNLFKSFILRSKNYEKR